MNTSLTSNLVSYLDSPDSAVIAPKHPGEGGLDSIYHLASKKGYLLNEFVTMFPNEALMAAERNVAEWNERLMEAITTGEIRSGSYKVKVNKYTSDLLKLRLEQSQRELTEVKRLSVIAGTTGAERIAKSMGYSAELGDTQAAKYVWDRIEGKVGEKQNDNTMDQYTLNLYKIIHSCFDKQLEILNHDSGGIIACCSRRSGKSHVAVALAMRVLLTTPNTNVLYISKTQKYAEKIFGKAMDQMISQLDLKDPNGKRFNWKKLQNGSEVIIRGLSNTRDPDAIRGFKGKVIIIDEYFHMKTELLEYIEEEVLGPMQLDYADSYLQLLIGTPPKDRQSHGEKVWQNFQGKKMKWTWRDNPFIVNGERYLENMCKEKGIDPKSAWFKREYEGEWIYDSDYLLYPTYATFDPDVSLPPINISKVVVGVDYGTSDQTSLVGVAWDTDRVQGYVFYEKKFNMMTTENGMSLINQLKIYAKQCWQMALDFFPTLEPKERNRRILWVADSNGMSQSLSQELNRGVRFIKMPDLSIQIKDAHRADGKMMQDKIRDLFRLKSLLIPANGLTAIECELCAYKKDVNGNPMSEIDHKQFHPEILTSLRYAMWELVGRLDIGSSATEFDLENLDGVEYGGSLDIAAFEMSNIPQYKSNMSKLKGSVHEEFMG
jgi:hypothetical protein